MGLMDKARQTAEQAAARAGLGGQPAADSDEPNGAAPPPPSARAGAAFSAFLERINPGLLADLIVHATAAQEKTNKALKEKGSQYRISEMYLTASIPPQIGFYIARIGDAEDDGGLPALPVPVKKAAVAKKGASPARS